MKKLIWILIVVSLPLWAKQAAVLSNVEGEVFVIEGDATQQAKNGMQVRAQAVIETKEGHVRVVFEDDSVMDVGPQSIVKIEKFIFDPAKNEFDFELYMSQGECGFESGKIGTLAPQKFQFKTPQGVVAIRGTKFFVKLQ